MYEKLEKKSNDSELNEILKNNLFFEFENQINVTIETDSKNIKMNSITNIINISIDKVIDDIVTDLININPILLSSKNIRKIAKICEKFFRDSNFGMFEYVQKTGMSIFKVEHSSGVNGTEFLKKFFEKIFEISLKGYSFYIISNENYVCVMFR
ncbi:MAG: hypothetical protein K8Q89_05550 [Nitrosarchaeum sp.]|nr:hypothetical protein [Nitrosarchaeum sp.]